MLTKNYNLKCIIKDGYTVTIYDELYVFCVLNIGSKKHFSSRNIILLYKACFTLLSLRKYCI